MPAARPHSPVSTPPHRPPPHRPEIHETGPYPPRRVAWWQRLLQIVALVGVGVLLGIGKTFLLLGKGLWHGTSEILRMVWARLWGLASTLLSWALFLGILGVLAWQWGPTRHALQQGLHLIETRWVEIRRSFSASPPALSLPQQDPLWMERDAAP